MSNRSNAEPFPWRAGRGAQLRGLSPQRDRAGGRRSGASSSPHGSGPERGREGSEHPLSREPAQGQGSPPRRGGTHRLWDPRLSRPRAEGARAEGGQVAGAAPRAPPSCRPELMRTAPAATHGGRIKRPGGGSAQPGPAPPRPGGTAAFVPALGAGREGGSLYSRGAAAVVSRLKEWALVCWSCFQRSGESHL